MGLRVKRYGPMVISLRLAGEVGLTSVPSRRNMKIVCLELRSLPSTGVTRLQRYCEPLRHPKAPDRSLAGVRLVVADHAMGLPCCVRFPCVHAAANTPV
jgi:hypothetical protein